MTAPIDQFTPEITFTLPGLSGGPGEHTLTIAIAKLGGGTLGRAYDGRWEAVARYGDALLHHSDDLNTPQPATHEQAARQLAVFLAARFGNDELYQRLSAFAAGELTPTTTLPKECI